MEVQNACVIYAMRKLLGDTEWGPEEIVQLIQKHDGFPSEENEQLEAYAPVCVWGPTSLDWNDEGWFKITQEWKSREILPFEKVIISYLTTEGRAHMECILMQDFPSYAEKKFLCFITKEVYG